MDLDGATREALFDFMNSLQNDEHVSLSIRQVRIQVKLLNR
jgi:hypothetical protein